MTIEHLDEVEFADNPEPRCPVVLLLDVSGSMAGRPINELNQGLQDFASVLKTDRLAALRVEVAVITFGGQVRALDVRRRWTAGYRVRCRACLRDHRQFRSAGAVGKRRDAYG